MEKITEKNFKTIYYPIVVLSFLFYLVLAFGNNYVWADEAFSFGMTRLRYDEIWNLPPIDTHPLLYYFYLKFIFSIFGSSVFIAKLASIFPYLFILSYSGNVLKKLFDERTAIFFIVLFFFFTAITKYSIEIRMYSLASAFVFSNAIFAYLCYVEKKGIYWVLLTICSAGAAYTHYYAFVSIILIDLILLISIFKNNPEKIKYWFLSFAGMVLLYLPWMSNCIKQLEYRYYHQFWIKPISIRTVFGYASSIFRVGDIKLLRVIPALCYLVVFLYVLDQKDRRQIHLSICLLLVPVLTIGIGILVSILVRPVFVSRYVVPALPLLVLFMAVSLGRMESDRLRNGIFLIFFACGIFNFFVFMRDEYKQYPNELESSLLSQYPYSDCDSYVVLNENDHISTVLAYYEEEKPIYSKYIMSTIASPFRNVHELEGFDESKYQDVILFINPDDQNLQEYRNNNSMEYLGRLDEMGNGIDAYHMVIIN